MSLFRTSHLLCCLKNRTKCGRKIQGKKFKKKEQSRVEKQHKKITTHETWQKEVEQDGKDEN